MALQIGMKRTPQPAPPHPGHVRLLDMKLRLRFLEMGIADTTITPEQALESACIAEEFMRKTPMDDFAWSKFSRDMHNYTQLAELLEKRNALLTALGQPLDTPLT